MELTDVNTLPNCSQEPEPNVTENQLLQENDRDSIASREMHLNTVEFNSGATTSFERPIIVNNNATISYTNESQSSNQNNIVPLSWIFSRSTFSTNPAVVTTQPIRTLTDLPSPISLNIPVLNQPQTLFFQALAKLKDSNLSIAVLNHLKNANPTFNCLNNLELKSEEISPPDSLTSAPPSYSFVLRQMAGRRRPRLMGTFIPSPSFVQHTPPPNYAAAFDIYVDSPIPPPPPRVFNFGFTSSPAMCPECGYTGLTVITTKITICTHVCAFILCLFCCWVCAPLPYVLRSCKDVYHYCRNCRTFLGMYCPTNPENVYP